MPMPPRKFLIFFIGAFTTLSVFLGIYLTIEHWKEVNWDLVSISPEKVGLSIIVNSFYLTMLFLTKNKHLTFWIMGFAWLIFNIFTLAIIEGMIVFG